MYKQTGNFNDLQGEIVEQLKEKGVKSSDLKLNGKKNISLLKQKLNKDTFDAYRKFNFTSFSGLIFDLSIATCQV